MVDKGTLKVSGTTRLIGIIGWPVDHSLSPAMHNAAFAALGLDYAYVPLPVAPGRVREAVEGLRALGFRGANVTVPHKQAVLPHLDELDNDARLAGAVNTIVVEGERLVGFNTDVAGFGHALAELHAGSLRDMPVLLLGAGGAARAAVVLLARAGADVTIVNRTRQAAEDALEVARAAAPTVAARALGLDALEAERVAAAGLIVNATTLGMAGAGKVPDVIVDNVREGHVVFDVVYTRQPTPLVAQARRRGARAADGLSMLIWQAAASFELWTGRAGPLDVMSSAVTR
jgi:shikimate dehydrogenase